MISRLLPSLMLLTACGAGGVCAGCGGDDGDAGGIPDAFHAQTAPAIMNCDGPGTIQANIAVSGGAGESPTLSPTMFATDITCTRATDRGDTWVIRCEAGDEPSLDTRWSELELLKTLDGGTYTIGGQMCGAGMNDEVRSTTIQTVAIP